MRISAVISTSLGLGELSPKCDREKKSDRGMLCVTMCVSGCRVIQWTPRAHLRQALKPKISKNSIFEIRLAARSNLSWSRSAKLLQSQVYKNRDFK
jgi:hypothetical protein